MGLVCSLDTDCCEGDTSVSTLLLWLQQVFRARADTVSVFRKGLHSRRNNTIVMAYHSTCILPVKLIQCVAGSVDLVCVIY